MATSYVPQRAKLADDKNIKGTFNAPLTERQRWA